MKTKKPNIPSMLLKPIPTSDKISEMDQNIVQINDKDADGRKRKLPDNEVGALILNEFATLSGNGFFYYLPSRDVWKMNPQESRRPKSRTPEAPG